MGALEIVRRIRQAPPRRRHVTRSRRGLLAAATALGVVGTCLWATRDALAETASDTPHAGEDVTASTVCFVVHNGPDEARVVGTRFEARNADRGRVVLLVHGFGATRQWWDWVGDYSVARNLARAGYVVVSYDQLTAGESTYHGSYAATGLTGNVVPFETSRENIAEVIEQIRGTYPRSTTAMSACASGQLFDAVGREAKVILVGHSAGGGLVKGYDGEYSAIAPIDALVQAENSDAGSSDAIANLYVAKTSSPANIAAGQFSFFLDDGSTRTSKSISKATCAENIRLLLYAGIQTRPDLFAAVCNAAAAETVPYIQAQLALLGESAENNQLVARTPSGLPVLLAWADHDGIFPDDPTLSRGINPCGPSGCQRAEDNYWFAHCRCAAHVTTWTERESGHDFNLSATMPTFTDKVVAWLAANNLAPSSEASARVRDAAAGESSAATTAAHPPALIATPDTVAPSPAARTGFVAAALLLVLRGWGRRGRRLTAHRAARRLPGRDRDDGRPAGRRRPAP